MNIHHNERQILPDVVLKSEIHKNFDEIMAEIEKWAEILNKN